MALPPSAPGACQVSLTEPPAVVATRLSGAEATGAGVAEAWLDGALVPTVLTAFTVKK